MLERVMIIAGESSGELYGALLARTLRARYPSVRITGVGGHRMEAAGVELLSRIAGAFGAVEVMKSIGELRKTFHRVSTSLSSFRPQVLVLIDYPDFNMKVAREAKKLGIRILYYVSPQVWAWRKGRVRTIGSLIDMMAVILPFEEALYRDAGIPAEFVGHPVMDEMRDVLAAKGFGLAALGSDELKEAMKKELGIAADRTVLTVMPGSRRHEVERLLPVLGKTIVEMAGTSPNLIFVIPRSPDLPHDASALLDGEVDRLRTKLAGTGRPPDSLRVIKGKPLQVLFATDYAVIKSGTSTLQAAVARVPMVVVYRLAPVTYFLGRIFIKIRHFSLVNNLIERSLGDRGPFVRELLQHEVTTQNVTGELGRLISDGDYRERLREQMERVTDLFTGWSASERASDLVERLSH